MKTAFITGITGQDGSYLAELLLSKGYTVHGLIRRSSNFSTGRIDHIYTDPKQGSTEMFLHYGDLSDGSALTALLKDIAPDEVYNLGAQSHVKVSYQAPLYSTDIGGLGALRVLEAIRSLDKPVRFYQASSSEMYGKVSEVPQSETTPFHPRSPYACGKVFAYWQTVNYREAYDMFACNGILFNHESPRRGETFVTRKITKAAARIKLGLQNKLYLGNLDAQRDWGYAGDYVEAMWRMLQADKAEDFVIATGETHSVREFLDAAFALLDLDVEEYVEIDPAYFRPAEVDLLLGDPSKARKVLNWEPQVSFNQLVEMMVEFDMQQAHQERLMRDNGLPTSQSSATG